MRVRVLALSLSIVGMMPPLYPAYADSPSMFAQIVCAPTLGYFSIRRITVVNLPEKGPYLTEGLEPGRGGTAALRRSNLIFDSDGLKAEPFTGSIAGFTAPAGWGTGERAAFDVRVTGHRDHNSQESNYCMIADNVEVFVNGRSIGLMPLNPCKSGETLVAVEVAHNGVELEVKKCLEPSIFEDPTGNTIRCDSKPFGAKAR